ncbi:hypothetical protein D3C71_1552350 [compost metagenome]
MVHHQLQTEDVPIEPIGERGVFGAEVGDDAFDLHGDSFPFAGGGPARLCGAACANVMHNRGRRAGARSQARGLPTGCRQAAWQSIATA